MSIVNLKADMSAWLDAGGVETLLYFGDSCEPTLVVQQSFKELVDATIESYTDYSGKVPDLHYEEVKAFIMALEDVAAYAREQLLKRGERNED